MCVCVCVCLCVTVPLSRRNLSLYLLIEVVYVIVLSSKIYLEMRLDYKNAYMILEDFLLCFIELILSRKLQRAQSNIARDITLKYSIILHLPKSSY